MHGLHLTLQTAAGAAQGLHRRRYAYRRESSPVGLSGSSLLAACRPAPAVREAAILLLDLPRLSRHGRARGVTATLCPLPSWRVSRGNPFRIPIKRDRFSRALHSCTSGGFGTPRCAPPSEARRRSGWLPGVSTSLDLGIDPEGLEVHVRSDWHAEAVAR